MREPGLLDDRHHHKKRRLIPRRRFAVRAESRFRAETSSDHGHQAAARGDFARNRRLPTIHSQYRRAEKRD